VRLIEQYGDIVQAEDAAEKLRSLGILTHISSKDSYRISRAFTGALKVGLWAVLDFQYKDACGVLTKSKHIVTSGLSEENLVKMESEAREASVNFFNGILIKVGFSVAFVIGVLLYAYSKIA
jgi:hypothetical protein